MSNPSPEIDGWHLELWHSRFPCWILDPNTLAFLDANRAAIVEYGYSRHEFQAMTLLDLSPAEDLSLQLRYALHPGWKGRKAARTWRHQTKDKKIMNVAINRHELKWHDRTVELLVATLAQPEP